MCADNQTPLRVAVIDNLTRPDRVPIVRWHYLSTAQSSAIPGVPRLNWIGAQATGVSTHMRRTARRHSASVRRLSTLNGAGVIATPTNGGMFVQASPTVDESSMLSFCEVRWGGRRHHVFVRGLAGHGDITDNTTVRIVVSLCLFGAAGATFLTAEGPRGCPSINGLGATRVSGIRVDRELGLYELETIRRTAAAVRDLLITLPKTVPIEVVMEVPRVQYWAYLLAAYAAGTVPHRLLLRWWQYIDQRREQVARTLRNHLQTASVLACRRDLRVVESPGLDAAEPVLRTAITQGWPARYGSDPHAGLTAAMIMALLESPHGDEWRCLLHHLQTVQGPIKTPTALSLASYIWQLVRPSLVNHAEPRFTIMLDDISEHRLYIAAQRTVAALAKQDIRTGTAPHVLSGIFPLRRVFLAGQPATRSLFHLTANHFRTADGGELSGRELAAEVTRSWHGHPTFHTAEIDHIGPITGGITA